MQRIEELSEMFRRMPVALYRTTAGGKILAANTALANLLGYDSVEAMMTGLATVDSVYVDASQRRHWIDEISETGVVNDFDVELERPDGTTVWVQDTARAIRDANGRIAYFEGALIDVTEKVEAQRARDEFLATVSHELRNPITVMLGMGEELANNYYAFSDEDRRDMAKLIARQADDASWLIEDLLVAYRADVGRVAVSPQDFEIAKEAERVLEVVDQLIELELRGEESRVHADPRRTRQIVRNLVSNAIRYGGEQVFIRVEPTGDRVELRVCDSGQAIPQQELERIFKPFETGTGERHPKSVGLGLSVARKLARLMEGDLTYRHVDGFSCFVLSLPSV
jgi:PAS domain S-box-containing protein